MWGRFRVGCVWRLQVHENSNSAWTTIANGHESATRSAKQWNLQWQWNQYESIAHCLTITGHKVSEEKLFFSWSKRSSEKEVIFMAINLESSSSTEYVWWHSSRTYKTRINSNKFLKHSSSRIEPTVSREFKSSVKIQLQRKDTNRIPPQVDIRSVLQRSKHES